MPRIQKLNHSKKFYLKSDVIRRHMCPICAPMLRSLKCLGQSRSFLTLFKGIKEFQNRTIQKKFIWRVTSSDAISVKFFSEIPLIGKMFGPKSIIFDTLQMCTKKSKIEPFKKNLFEKWRKMTKIAILTPGHQFFGLGHEQFVIYIKFWVYSTWFFSEPGGGEQVSG